MMGRLLAAQKTIIRFRTWGSVGITLIFLHAVCLPVAWAEEPTPEFLIQQVINTYRSLDTYRGSGQAETEIIDFNESGSVRQFTTRFTILLKKPNLYRITWEQDFPYDRGSQGALWNNGSQAYAYNRIAKRYMDISTDLWNLQTRATVSSEATVVIPELFFSFFPEKDLGLSSLKDLVLKGREKIEGEQCYVLEGRNQFMVVTYWISTQNYFIRQYRQHIDTSSGIEIDREFIAEEAKAYLRFEGVEPTKERMARYQKVFHFVAKALENSRMQGTVIHHFSDISLPMVSAQDLQFAVPEGIPLKEDIYKISHSTVDELFDEFEDKLNVMEK